MHSWNRFPATNRRRRRSSNSVIQTKRESDVRFTWRALLLSQRKLNGSYEITTKCSGAKTPRIDSPLDFRWTCSSRITHGQRIHAKVVAPLSIAPSHGNNDSSTTPFMLALNRDKRDATCSTFHGCQPVSRRGRPSSQTSVTIHQM